MAATINLKVQSDFAAASADLKKFGTIAESERKRIEKFVDSFQTDQIDKFTDKARRNAAAIKATRGPVDALTAEYKQYQRQIESLIRRGLDPESKQIKTLTTQYKKLEKEIEDVGKAQARNQKRMKAVQGAMLAIGAGAVLMGKQAVTAFIDFSKEAAKAASDAEEIEGKFNVVFGGIADDATAAASKIAKDFDLANSTVNKLLGDTGDILTGLGFDQRTALQLSESVGTLALDLASFTNFAGGAEGASAALTKALLGEAESAKALGIVIRQDTAEYKALVQEQMDVNGLSLIQAKAMTALKIATDQSKNAIGDYARTMDSTANVGKRLGESTKALKEEWGRSVNEGLTPLRRALISVTDQWGALLKEQREVQEAIDRFNDGTGDAADEMVVLEQKLQTAKVALESITNEYGGNAEAIENLRRIRKEQIDTINAEIEAQNKLLLQQQTNDARNKQGASIQAKIAADRKASDEAFLTLAERVEARRQAGLTSEQKQIELLDIEIARQASLRTVLQDQGKVWSGVQQLINDLWAERLELQKETADLTEKEHTQIVAAGEDWLSIEQKKTDHLIWIDGLQQEIAGRRQQESDKATAASEKREAEFISMGNTIAGFASGPLTALGAALAKGEAGWAGFAKAGIGAIAEVVRALGKMAIVESAIRFARLDFAGGLAFAAAGAASFVAAGAIDAKAASFQTGTGSQPFTVPESTSSSRADNQRIAVSPGEQVSVTPRGESGINQSIFVQIDQQVLFDIINPGIESGEIRITADNIQGGIAV